MAAAVFTCEALVSPEPISCLACKQQFYPRRASALYCSLPCKKKVRRRRRRARYQHLGVGPKRRCLFCETEYRAKRHDGRGKRFCSRGCAFGWKAFLATSRPHVSVRKERCKRCLSLYVATGTRGYCSADCRAKPRPPKPTAECSECSTPFTPYSGRSHACPTCVPVVAKRKRKQAGIRSGATAAYRKARKLRQRGVKVEAVNPISLMERDGWRCQLCGVATPKKLRGSYDDRAPEVDHIIPIAQGGEHSYRNTQCACRKCNIAKADRPLGQMRLFG